MEWQEILNYLPQGIMGAVILVFLQFVKKEELKAWAKSIGVLAGSAFNMFLLRFLPRKTAESFEENIIFTIIEGCENFFKGVREKMSEDNQAHVNKKK